MTKPASPNALLIVWHSRTGASAAMATAAANSDAARLIAAHDVTPQDLIDAAGYLFVCPENLGSMSGTMKEMFDRTYYPVLGKLEGRPYATIIAAGSDGHGAQAQLDRIVTGWRLRRVADPIIVNFAAQTPEAILALKPVPINILKQCAELGDALAQGIAIGVF
jgi:NAD(P)H-dependent FMN reductase